MNLLSIIDHYKQKKKEEHIFPWEKAPSWATSVVLNFHNNHLGRDKTSYVLTWKEYKKNAKTKNIEHVSIEYCTWKNLYPKLKKFLLHSQSYGGNFYECIGENRPEFFK